MIPLPLSLSYLNFELVEPGYRCIILSLSPAQFTAFLSFPERDRDRERVTGA
jgi:hypothetical protein